MAATDVETLMVRMEANIRGYERALKRSQEQTRSAMKSVERDTTDTVKKIERALGGVNVSGFAASLKGLAGPLAAVLSVSALQSFADGFTQIQNSLKSAGFEGERLRATYQSIYEIAQRQSAPLEQTATLFARLSGAQRDLNTSTPEMLRFTELTAMALRVQGSSAAEAKGALLQLGQALGGGVIQAQEYNSLIDGARPLLQAVAAGLKEAGGSVSELTRLVKDGQVSSEAFFRAALAGASVLEDKLATATETTGQATQRLNNALMNMAGEMDRATGFSSALAGVIGAIATKVEQLTAAIPALIGRLREMGVAAQQVAATERTITGLQTRLRDAGLTDLQRRGLEQQLGAAQQAQRDAQGRQMLADDAVPFIPLPGSQTPAAGRAPIAPISLAQFPVKGKEAGGGGGGGGGGPKLDEYQRETEALTKRTAELDRQRTSLGLTAGEAARLEAAQKLMAAAMEAGKPVTAALRAEIDAQAEAYGRAKGALDSARESQQQFQQLQQFIGQSLSGFFSDVVSGGKNAQEALMNLTKRLADAALQAALLGQGPLAGLLGGGGQGGNVGGIIGSLFSGMRGLGLGFAAGGYVSGPGTGRSDSIPARLSNGEFVVNAAATRQNRALLESINSGRMLKLASGGMVGSAPARMLPVATPAQPVTVIQHIHAASEAVVARAAQAGAMQAAAATAGGMMARQQDMARRA